MSLPPMTPAVASRQDRVWTPTWQWCEQECDDDILEERPVRQNVLKVYNEAMTQIAGLSDLKPIEPLTFRLQCEWEEATKKGTIDMQRKSR